MGRDVSLFENRIARSGSPSSLRTMFNRSAESEGSTAVNAGSSCRDWGVPLRVGRGSDLLARSFEDPNTRSSLQCDHLFSLAPADVANGFGHRCSVPR